MGWGKRSATLSHEKGSGDATQTASQIKQALSWLDPMVT